MTQQQPPPRYQIDRFDQPPSNPSSPNRKRRSLRQLTVAERLRVVKLVATNTRTGQEVADLFNLKLHAIRDLTKDLKGKKTYFIDKRRVETRRILEEASIIGTIQNTINCQ